MYATNFIAGTFALTAVLQLTIGAMIPDPQPITINSLSYEDGKVTQDRSISGDDKISAVWEARVISVETGLAVSGCEGSGGWDYAPGGKAVTMPLTEWVGSPSCNLQIGQYQLFAQYRVGTWSTDARSEVFEVTR